MSDKLLHRSDAPFSEKTWHQIDLAVRDAAISEVSARRILETKGPYGIGLKSLPLADRPLEKESDDTVEVAVDAAVPMPLISTSFSIAARDIDNFERYGLPLDTGAASEAAVACARKEEQLLYYGAPESGIPGLLTGDGVQEISLKKWDDVGEAAEDIIRIIDKMDGAGFHGPFALALAPARYNALFRRYPQGPMIEISHIRELVTGGVIKAPAIQKGGVLICTGERLASIILGQDLLTAFEGPEGRNYTFVLSESLGLRLSTPAAVCRLK
ncbi:MAG: DUF2184 domain-containing protein [Chitinivibrionales bacterium]|nr:DUF2184 domain-containing protein [Chitinivibrionales bacterium]MBD3356732.1 DUF2184 domain-containing protein [Chitinivibrionales bacterium]